MAKGKKSGAQLDREIAKVLAPRTVQERWELWYAALPLSRKRTMRRAVKVSEHIDWQNAVVARARLRDAMMHKPSQFGLFPESYFVHVAEDGTRTRSDEHVLDRSGRPARRAL